MLSKTSAYVKIYDRQTKLLHFLLKMATYWKNININTIWDKISVNIKIEYDSSPAYNKKIEN